MQLHSLRRSLYIFVALLTIVELGFMIEVANFISCENDIYENGKSFANHDLLSFHKQNPISGLDQEEHFYSNFETYKSQIDIYRFIGLILG